MVSYYRRKVTGASYTGLIIAMIVLFFLGEICYPYATKGQENVVVTAAVIKNYDKSSKYLIFTDHGVFENTDSLAYLKYSSSDMQSVLMQPGKYHIEYYGYRIPFFSAYPNIISAQRIQ